MKILSQHTNKFKLAWRARERGQGMVEYTVILAFGVIMLLGPGGNVLLDLEAVMQNKYRGYSYSMSMSPLPDFETGPELAAYIDAQNLAIPMDDDTLRRWKIDPGQENVTAALEPFTSAYQQFNDIGALLSDLPNLDDLARDMLEDAISPF